MHEPTVELLEREVALIDEDLQRIASLTGEGSYLHQLAIDQSPDFIDELHRFLTTHRYARLVQEPHDEAESTAEHPVSPVTYVNPEFIHNGLKQIADLKYFIRLYTERTGREVIIMQTDYSNDPNHQLRSR